MSARFAELMAISASQSRESDLATQQILAEKKRKEELRRKEQEEKAKKEREAEARAIKKKLEDEQREAERRQKAEDERQKKEQVLQRRQEEKRNNLIYGKERRSGWGSSSGGGRTHKSRSGSDDDDDGPSALTREEKRQRRLNSDLNKSFTSSRRGGGSSSTSFPRKPVSSRPFNSNGASVITVADVRRHHQSNTIGDAAKSGLQTMRQQLAAVPATLMRVGVEKRDKRSIDEIVNDIQKKKRRVLEGDEARKNGDWFGEKKKHENMKKPTQSSSLSPSPEEGPSSSLQSSRAKEQPAVKPILPKPMERKEQRTKVTLIKPELKGSLSFSKIDKSSISLPKKLGSTSSRASTVQSSKGTSSTLKSTGSSTLKKRARSNSFSDSEDLDSPPSTSKRRSTASSIANDVRTEIWKLFGKDRNRYMQEDVFSDEEDDMEADASAVLREEKRSTRIAKQEDDAALEEELRHEEEKRRKKKERERKGY